MSPNVLILQHTNSIVVLRDYFHCPIMTLKVLKYVTEGNIWNEPSRHEVFSIIERNFDQSYHLNKVPISELAVDIAKDIRKNPQQYWDGNVDCWCENFHIRAYRASNVADVEYLLKFRRDYYGHRTYLIFFAFEASRFLEDIIGIEILVLPPEANMFSSDDDEEFHAIDIGGDDHSPPIEE